jgi:hypothetical protein
VRNPHQAQVGHVSGDRSVDVETTAPASALPRWNGTPPFQLSVAEHRRRHPDYLGQRHVDLGTDLADDGYPTIPHLRGSGGLGPGVEHELPDVPVRVEDVAGIRPFGITGCPAC